MEQEQKAKNHPSEKSGEGVRAVDRALDVLTAFEPGDSELLVADLVKRVGLRSEEHTSELQSLMRISYAVFCLKKKNTHTTTINQPHNLHYQLRDTVLIQLDNTHNVMDRI